MIKYFKARKEEKQKEALKAELIRQAKIRGAVVQVQNSVKEELQFLVNIGQYNKRKKYLLTDREIEERKEAVINKIFGQVGILTVLSMLQKERDAADRKVQKGKRLPVQAEAEALIKELFK